MISLETLDTKLNKVDKKLGKLEPKFEALERRLDILESRFDALEERFDQLEKKLLKNQEIFFQRMRVENEHYMAAIYEKFREDLKVFGELLMSMNEKNNRTEEKSENHDVRITKLEYKTAHL